MDGTNVEQPLANLSAPLPDGYEFRDGEIRKVGPRSRGNGEYVCPELALTAIVIDDKGKTVGKRFLVQDSTGQRAHVLVKTIDHNVRGRIVKLFSDAGFEFGPGYNDNAAFRDLLRTWSTDRRTYMLAPGFHVIESVELHMGPLGEVASSLATVGPHRPSTIIDPYFLEYEGKPIDTSTAGTLDSWIAEVVEPVAELADKAPHFAVGLATGGAGIVSERLGLQPAIEHLVGPTHRGKTTIAQSVQVSWFCNPTIDAALLRKCVEKPDLDDIQRRARAGTFALDEGKILSKWAVEKMAYQGGGAGHTYLSLSSEEPLKDLMPHFDDVLGGALARMPHFDCDLFEGGLQGDDKRRAEKIGRAVLANYGIAWAKFSPSLLALPVDDLRAHHERHTDTLLKNAPKHIVERAARAFATLLTVVDLMDDFAMLGANAEKVHAALTAAVWAEWQAFCEADSTTKALDTVGDCVRAFEDYLRHHSAPIVPIHKNARLGTRSTNRHAVAFSWGTQVYATEAAFDAAKIPLAMRKKVVKAIAQAGKLTVPKNGKGGYWWPDGLPGIGSMKHLRVNIVADARHVDDYVTTPDLYIEAAVREAVLGRMRDLWQIAEQDMQQGQVYAASLSADVALVQEWKEVVEEVDALYPQARRKAYADAKWRADNEHVKAIRSQLDVEAADKVVRALLKSDHGIDPDESEFYADQRRKRTGIDERPEELRHLYELCDRMSALKAALRGAAEKAETEAAAEKARIEAERAEARRIEQAEWSKQQARRAEEERAKAEAEAKAEAALLTMTYDEAVKLPAIHAKTEDNIQSKLGRLDQEQLFWNGEVDRVQLISEAYDRDTWRDGRKATDEEQAKSEALDAVFFALRDWADYAEAEYMIERYAPDRAANGRGPAADDYRRKREKGQAQLARVEAKWKAMEERGEPTMTGTQALRELVRLVHGTAPETGSDVELSRMVNEGVPTGP